MAEIDLKHQTRFATIHLNLTTADDGELDSRKVVV